MGDQAMTDGSLITGLIDKHHPDLAKQVLYGFQFGMVASTSNHCYAITDVWTTDPNPTVSTVMMRLENPWGRVDVDKDRGGVNLLQPISLETYLTMGYWESITMAQEVIDGDYSEAAWSEKF